MCSSDLPLPLFLSLSLSLRQRCGPSWPSCAPGSGPAATPSASDSEGRRRTTRLGRRTPYCKTRTKDAVLQDSDEGLGFVSWNQFLFASGPAATRSASDSEEGQLATRKKDAGRRRREGPAGAWRRHRPSTPSARRRPGLFYAVARRRGRTWRPGRARARRAAPGVSAPRRRRVPAESARSGRVAIATWFSPHCPARWWQAGAGPLRPAGRAGTLGMAAGTG